MTSQAFLTYALNQHGDLAHVDSVPNGNDCGCICPHCKSPLCAKNEGEKREHHFAHQSGVDCGGAVESAMHKMAKDILLESKCVFLPNNPDGSQGELLHFDHVEVEFQDTETNLRPDCIGYYGEKSLWIEFKRTHAVDEKKAKKIISAHKLCIEIDLNGCHLDPNEVKQFITNSAENRKWIEDIVFQKGKGMSYSNLELYMTPTPYFVKDDKSNIINVQRDKIYQYKQYYCLGCGKELSAIFSGTAYYGIRLVLERCSICPNKKYYKGAAMEIIYSKFCNSENFEITIPYKKKCERHADCELFSEAKCWIYERKSFDLKKYYLECKKDELLPDFNFKSDLILKREGSFDGSILICINRADSLPDKLPSKYKLIDIKIRNASDLSELYKKGIGESDNVYNTDGCIATFSNFNIKDVLFASPFQIKRIIVVFKLFATGTYSIAENSCVRSEERFIRPSFEILFLNLPEVLKLTYSDLLRKAKLFSIKRCRQLKKEICICEICDSYKEKLFATDNNGICNRHNSMRTPEHPMKEMPIDCPYFAPNVYLLNTMEQEFSNVRFIEKEYDQTELNKNS